MKTLRNIIIAVCGCVLGLAACVNGERPTSLMPEVWVDPPGDITRYTAELSGGVRLSEKADLSVCRFLLGASADDLQEKPTLLADGHATSRIDGLESGTDYYFCLEVGNGKQQVRSDVMHFRTLPDGPATLGSIDLMGQTPVSLWVSCSIVDTGGNIRSAGFVYRAATETQEKEIAAEPDGTNTIRALLPQLQMNTEYVIRAFSDNSFGRSYSETFQINTGDAVVYERAGQLSTMMGELGQYPYTSIRVMAPMNGDDLRFLRGMAGCKTTEGAVTENRLETIDLSGATLKEGGISYDGSRFVQADVVSTGLFADMPELKELVLPESAVKVEEDAFARSPKLEKLTLPLKLREMNVSTECPMLKNIGINDINPNYATVDGLLYNKAVTDLVWCPNGYKADKLTLPATLTRLKKLSFVGCAIREIAVPESVTSIEELAFAQSGIESIVLPDRMTRIDKGLFQQCAQLTKITLGSRVDYICEYAFDGCALQTLCVPADYPPVCQSNAFAGVDMTKCTVYVPAEKLTLYRGNLTWGKFILRRMQ